MHRSACNSGGRGAALVPAEENGSVRKLTRIWHGNGDQHAHAHARTRTHTLPHARARAHTHRHSRTRTRTRTRTHTSTHTRTRKTPPTKKTQTHERPVPFLRPFLFLVQPAHGPLPTWAHSRLGPLPLRLTFAAEKFAPQKPSFSVSEIGILSGGKTARH